MSTTDKRALAEMVYPGDLHMAVTALNSANVPWRDIATAINRQLPHGFEVSRESLRRWYGSDTEDVA